MLMAPLIAATLIKRRRASARAFATASSGLAGTAIHSARPPEGGDAASGERRAEAGIACFPLCTSLKTTSAPHMSVVIDVVELWKTEIVHAGQARVERVIRCTR
jgi:hypothetical protein